MNISERILILDFLDQNGLHDQVDLNLRKIVAQNATDQLNRNLTPSALAAARNWQYIKNKFQPLAKFLSQFNLTLNNFAKNLHILAKYSLIGGDIDFLSSPSQFNSIKNVIQEIAKNPQLSQQVDDFLRNFPQIYNDLRGVNQTFKSSMGLNYFNWFTNQSSLLEFKRAFSLLKQQRELAIQLARQGGGVYDITKITTPQLQTALNGIKANKELNGFIQYAQNTLKANKIPYNKLKTPTDYLRALQKYNLLEKNTIGGNNLISRVGNLIKYSDDATQILTDATRTGAIIQPTNNALKAAKVLSSKFAGLSKFIGPLGIVLSLPAAVTWTQKIADGKMNWDDPNERLDFIQDLTSLVAAVTFMIPGAQGISAALAVISVALIGVRNFVPQPNSADEKILGTYKPKTEQDQTQFQSDEKLVSSLLEEVTPGNSSNFNNWMGSQNPQYDFRVVKMTDLLNYINEFTKQPQFSKLYSWYHSPNEQNKWMLDQFKQKLLNLKKLVQSRGVATGDTLFNSLNDVLLKLKKDYPGRFDSFNNLKDVMASSVWSGWFKNVPKNLDDVQLVQWFNKFPKLSDWAY